jgi:hypothetical protein
MIKILVTLFLSTFV